MVKNGDEEGSGKDKTAKYEGKDFVEKKDKTHCRLKNA